MAPVRDGLSKKPSTLSHVTKQLPTVARKSHALVRQASGSAAVAGDRVVVGGRDKLVHCLNAKTGKSIWTFATRARVDSSPAIAGYRVYVGSNDGLFYVLDLATGKKVWQF